ncbi:MAG: ATP-binding cassette domain-containing protein [Butyrivibrio sp.]|uniref:energy-coupling factor transporter ATPase n=1 Tax=Butyrivibrio sp. TaxID=28121 RepID=UPI0025F03B69|nr:energy-coupling factor transporter ATPase [Butyrivibrio sp.]MCR5771848.1 ATP-binding cassette domain-containing protein [Butyrivibrio sp.]
MIRFDNVSFHYGGENGTGEGVDNIDLTIKDGEVVVLCGASGCGKTTITRLINGLAPSFYEGEMEGSVWVDDTCVTNTELSETSKLVGSVFQNPKSQFFNIDTTSELVFGCENQGMPRDQIHERLLNTQKEMKLDALMNRNIFELSGGEKQQIACGSVYTASPSVFVLDEPSSNLDRKAIHRLHDTLKKIKSEGKTIVISEHRLYYLMDIADRFIYLDDGVIQKSYTSADLSVLSDDDLKKIGLRIADLSMLKRNDHKYDTGIKQPVIEALDLSCTRGGNQILDIERLSLPEHSIVAVIGDNGCGKSTLSEALCGIGTCDGSIGFKGVYLSEKERSQKSFMVMQDVNRQLFSDSVIEEVMLNSSVSRKDAENILDKLGLKDTMERHPSSLSGGQKQRVAIASALCAGKEIIFYDEPTSGLDRCGMERFGKLLNDMRNKITSVIITHDPELILTCCTHVLHIENGRVLAFYPLNEEGVCRIKAYFMSENDDNTSKRRPKYGMFGRVLKYTGKWKKYVYIATFFLVSGAAFGVIPYIGIYDILTRLLSSESVTLSNSIKDIGIVLIFGILSALASTFGLQYSHRAAYHTLENIRINLQDKLDKQPIGNIHELGVGAIKKLFNEDVEAVEVMLAHAIPQGFSNIFVGAAVMIVLIGVDWQMALFSLIILAFGISASKQMYNVGMDRMGTYFASSKRLNNTIIEYVSGMEVVRIFNRDTQSEERFEESVKNYRDFGLDWYKVCWPWMALYGSLFSNMTLYSLPLGAFLVVIGYITISRYILALCLSFALGPMLVNTLTLIGTLPRVNYKIQSIEKALDRAPLKCGEETFNGKDHDVVFNHVRFSYKGNEALKDISFTAKEGEMTALVGASGSGKSTIARLLAHYYDTDSGVISIGGQDISRMSLGALGNEVAYVSQELFLFNKSIMENIRIGRPGASDDEVIDAAIKAGCDDFIRDLEKGYDTLAGTMGNKLSGGQKQRIAFARVLLKDAPIIVLDEATAFVDPENEKKMNDAIEEITRGKTVIVIAHKLSSIVKADKIIVLDKGNIISEGKHGQLLGHCEEYKKLWKAAGQSNSWVLKGGQLNDSYGA